MYRAIFSVSIILLLSVFISSCESQINKKSQQHSAAEIKTTPTDTSITETITTPPNQNSIFIQHHSNLDGMVSEFVRKGFQDKNGNYWFGTNGDGVILYNGVSLEKFTASNGFGGTAVRGIREDKAGNVWFGTSGGLTKYDGESFTNYSTKEGFIR